MEKLNYSIKINAPREKVYKNMLDDKTYRQWTEPFCPGSYAETDWKKGSKALFLGPDQEGKYSGMVSRIAENIPNEYVSIEHLGVVNNGVEDTESDAVKAWKGAMENYTFREADGGTEVLVDMDTDENYSKMFNEMWPKALQKLKEISEA
ncbi:MAG: SRPBCC domain-containing protein [Ignavibacteria bacterium]|nr:SRPBCC domain-containing protein [Ignavibacteria bacterium]